MAEPFQGGLVDRRNSRFLVNDDHCLHRRRSSGPSPICLCDHRAHGNPTDGTRRIVVDDLAAAIEFFVELGLEPRGKGQVEGSWVDRIVALDEVRVEFAMRYEDIYWLCYVRGPEGIVIELAEKIG